MMNSKTQVDPYFTNLLQQGSSILSDDILTEPSKMGHYLNQNTEGATHESQFSPQMDAKKSRAANFNIDEDNLLVSGWLNTTLDAVHGNDQKHKTYWKRIWEYFHKYKTFCSERSQNSLMNRWSVIQLGTNKFCGFFAQIESLHQSGVTEQDKIGKAKLMYQEIQKATFQFEHCWNLLRYQPKWLQECEKRKPKKRKTPSSPSTPESINLGDDDISADTIIDLERPQGTKAAKELLKKKKSNKGFGTSNASVVLEGLMEERKKSNEKNMEILEKSCLQEQENEQERLRIKKEKRLQEQENEQERLRIKKEKLRGQEMDRQERIMMMDTSGLSPMQQQFYAQRKKEILESRTSKE